MNACGLVLALAAQDLPPPALGDVDDAQCARRHAALEAYDAVPKARRVR